MINDENDYEIKAPAAGAMIESLRAYGYSPAAAIADIIDNSISAGARTIWIYFYWAARDSYISILDDGPGMDESTLSAAMRPGSCNPLEERSPKDLGRFGMGLKTASFSQCKNLTVKSKTKNGVISLRRWDINHVIDTNEWQLLKNAKPDSEHILACLDSLKTGTLVLWDDLDKLMGETCDVNSHDEQQRFLKIIDEVKAYLEMVFHNFLSGLNPSIKIEVNGNKLFPWDPFCEIHPATIAFPEEKILHPHGDTIIKGFVLPHKDKLTSEAFEANAGPGGWNARQGIYIYRNKRLLVAGGWLGLGDNKPWMQEEQYKLSRIRIDISNTQDFDWLIDVKKSSAKPPAWIKHRLIMLSDKVRTRAREVFAHRGTYGSRPRVLNISRIWLPVNKEGRMSYRLDRHHHLIQALDSILLTKANREIFSALLRSLEETLPISSIWLNTAENSDNHSMPFETESEMGKRRLVEISYEILRQQKGLSADASRKKLLEMESFQDETFQDIIYTLNN